MKRRVRKDSPDPIDAYVGGRVRSRRMELHMSQTRLGEMIGVTFQQVQKYENGSNRIGSSNLYRIARALGVDVGWLFRGVEEVAPSRPGLAPPPATHEHDPMRSREAIEIVHGFTRIVDPEVRSRLLRFVRALAGPIHD